MQDKTWIITAKLQVTTLSGWEPELSDVEGWLDDGSSLLLVSVEKVEEAK